MPKTGVSTTRPFSNLFNVAASRSAQMTTMYLDTKFPSARQGPSIWLRNLRNLWRISDMGIALGVQTEGAQLTVEKEVDGVMHATLHFACQPSLPDGRQIREQAGTRPLLR